MKKAALIIKSIFFPLLLAAGVAVLVLWCRAALRIPHLHLALSEVRFKTVCLLAGLLLAAAFAVVAAEYTLFNLKDAFWKLLIPAFACLALLALCGLCFRKAVPPLAYSYTDAVSDYEAEFDASRFRAGDQQLFPEPVTGTVTGYRLYRDGPLEAEIVTVTYELAPYYTEARRIQRMGLSGFEISDERYCYELPQEDCLYQIDVNSETHQIFYRRFLKPDSLPAYAPHPETEPEEPEITPGLVTDFSEYFDAARFQVEMKQLFPVPLTGQVRDYLLYRNGSTAAEAVTVEYTLAQFYTETSRIRRLFLSSFRLDENRICYQWKQDRSMYQIEVDSQTCQIIYRRFAGGESLPYYAPHPASAPTVRSTEPTEESDPEEDTPAEPSQTLPTLPGVH